MLHQRRRFGWLLLAALILPILAACGGAATTPGASAPAASTAAASAAASEAAASTAASAPASAEPATESPAASTATGSAGNNILRVHQPNVISVADPQQSSYSAEIMILSLTYEGLTKLDSNLQAVPAAAESWEFNDDATAMTFTLRSGLKYSDGSPLTSERFRYAVQRTCDPAVAGSYQSILFEIVGCEEFASTPVTDTAAYEAARDALGVQAPDERTLVLNFNRPAPYYTYISGLWVMYPAKQELIEAGGPNWWQDPTKQIGNGPFQFTEYAEEQQSSFVANENYWEGRPKLDGIELVYQQNRSVALEAFRQGDLDIVQPDPEALAQIRSDAALSDQLLFYPGANTFQLAFNLSLEPFNDKKVREAFSYAFDRATFCEIVRGDCVPTVSWIPKGIPGYVETDLYSYDPEKAKQALAESTYGSAASLPPIKLSYNASDPANQPRMEWIAGQYRDILGIEMTLDPIEQKAFTEARNDPATFPQAAAFMNWYQDYPDPQNWLSLLWTCTSRFARNQHYCNPEFDELVRQGDTNTDQAKRIQFYEQAHQLLLNDLIGPNLYNVANVFLVNPAVTGYTPTSSDSEIPGQWGSLLTIDVTR
jgi:oligopeptide transport system substrate-binding protein